MGGGFFVYFPWLGFLQFLEHYSSFCMQCWECLHQDMHNMLFTEKFLKKKLPYKINFARPWQIDWETLELECFHLHERNLFFFFFTPTNSCASWISLSRRKHVHSFYRYFKELLPISSFATFFSVFCNYEIPSKLENVPFQIPPLFSVHRWGEQT